MKNNGKALEQLVAKIQEVIKENDSTTIGVEVRLKDKNKLLREFDVLVKTTNQGLSTIIAFECKDYSTSKKKPPVDVKIVDGFIGKCADIPEITQKVIVSTTGFSNSAKTKAKQHGIILLSIEEIASDKFLSITNMIGLKNVSKFANVCVCEFGNGQELKCDAVPYIWDSVTEEQIDIISIRNKMYHNADTQQEHIKLFVNNNYKPLYADVELASNGRWIVIDDKGIKYPLQKIHFLIKINFEIVRGELERVQSMQQGMIDVNTATYGFDNTNVKLKYIEANNNNQFFFDKDNVLIRPTFKTIL